MSETLVQLPAFMLGKSTTWSICGCTVDPATFAVSDGTVYVMQGVITQGGFNSEPITENNSPMHLKSSNFMKVEENHSITIEEMMQITASAGVGTKNVLSTIQAGFDYARVTRVIGGKTYDFLGLIGPFNDQVTKPNVKATMTLLQTATISATDGTSIANPAIT